MIYFILDLTISPQTSMDMVGGIFSLPEPGSWRNIKKRDR